MALRLHLQSLELQFRSPWSSLGEGSYVINSLQLALPVTVHAGHDDFMLNYIDGDFWVGFKGNMQYWNGNQGYWDNWWSGGGAVNGWV